MDVIILLIYVYPVGWVVGSRSSGEGTFIFSGVVVAAVPPVLAGASIIPPPPLLSRFARFGEFGKNGASDDVDKLGVATVVLSVDTSSITIGGTVGGVTFDDGGGVVLKMTILNTVSVVPPSFDEFWGDFGGR